ncbi:MAG: hypothetical protein LLG20_02040 [Acidobacteriales bacterium]|nr:hypothetical protein [Terriglobales bacterium]
MSSILLAGGVLAAAQNLAETSLAAATGSVAGVAGKPVSNGVSKIFGKVNAQTKSAAAPAKQKNVAHKGESAVGKTAIGTRGAAAKSPRWTARARSAALRPRMQWVEPPPKPAPQPVVAKVPPPAPQPTSEQIASIRTGAGRADVLAKLGTPTARLSIPGSGQLIEIYQYMDNRGNVGTVRLRDGLVSEVRVPNRND